MQCGVQLQQQQQLLQQWQQATPVILHYNERIQRFKELTDQRGDQRWNEMLQVCVCVWRQQSQTNISLFSWLNRPTFLETIDSETSSCHFRFSTRSCSAFNFSSLTFCFRSLASIALLLPPRISTRHFWLNRKQSFFWSRLLRGSTPFWGKIGRFWWSHEFLYWKSVFGFMLCSWRKFLRFYWQLFLIRLWTCNWIVCHLDRNPDAESSLLDLILTVVKYKANIWYSLLKISIWLCASQPPRRSSAFLLLFWGSSHLPTHMNQSRSPAPTPPNFHQGWKQWALEFIDEMSTVRLYYAVTDK